MINSFRANENLFGRDDNDENQSDSLTLDSPEQIEKKSNKIALKEKKQFLGWDLNLKNRQKLTSTDLVSS